MGIWTIVKANIRAHKTQFISLILLTVFCVASVIAFYNVNESSKESILYEYDCINVADECLVVERSDFTEEMEASFANAKQRVMQHIDYVRNLPNFKSIQILLNVDPL